MCEFCIQHGAGKKWYLAAQNYTEKLILSEGRESFINDFFKNYEKNYRRNNYLVDLARKIPFTKKYGETKFQNYFIKKHPGQIIPLEDAISICSIPGRVSVIDCPCQKYLLNKKEKKCILFGTTADIVENIPQFDHITDMDYEAAVDLLKSTDAEGKVHTVWAFKPPYIGAICNCNHRGCLFFHLQNKYNEFAKVIMKGHEIAKVNPEICIECKNCQKICQFDAIITTGKKLKINERKCHGCGLCRNHCPANAIQLLSQTIL